MWDVRTISNASSPLIYKGHAYANRIHRVACVELETGKLKWEQKKCGVASVASPVIADDKIYFLGGDRNGKSFMMVAADPEKFTRLGLMPLKVARCSSPAIAEGKVYLRLRNAVACFDLTPPH